MRIASLLLVLSAFMASCGGSSDPKALTSSGETSLGTQDWASAAGDFEAALKAIGADTAHPMYVRAKLGMAEALGSSNPAESKSILTELQKALPGKATVDDWIKIMNAMAGSTNDDAISVTAAAIALAQKNFPESLDSLDEIGAMLAKKAAESGNEDAASALDGLGYTGGD
jgi:hypothetical protein